MRAKQRERAPLALARVRLVGFHNFVDETIEIGAGGAAGGGHLFLLGDNGSGKTTVLDAIHLALTGGDIELNAAARIGGRRQEGRSLAGIVLRQAPSGSVREGASIAYVALELASATERHVVGVGLAATTLQAMVSRWGIVHRGTLEDVSLTISTAVPGSPGPHGVAFAPRTTAAEITRGERERPRTRDELAAALGPSAVLGRIGDYRARVADLLFGGEAAYERASRLWSIAKAYRELALGTREPGALFERFLPVPSSEVLDAVQRSLQQLGELETSLSALEARRAYVAGVASCRAEISAIRRERARLDHAELVVRERTLRAERTSVATERERARAELADCAARLADAEERAGRADAVLATLHSGDAAIWARDVATAERDRDVRRNELSRLEATRDRALGLHDAASTARADTQRTLEDAIRAAHDELRRATEDASRLPTLLPHCAAASSPSAEPLEAEDELRAASTSAHAASAAAELRLHEIARARTQLDATEDADGGPDARLLDALRGSRIEASRLFELLEPLPSADVVRIAALEAVVPSDTWRTVVTHASDLPRARAALADHPGARLAVHEARTAVLASWALELFEPPHCPLAERALGLLAHELTQIGPLDAPDALGGVTLRGALVRPTQSVGLLGSESRARARLARDRAREARARELDADRAAALTAREGARAHLERLGRVERALRGLSSPDIRSLRVALAERERSLGHAWEAAEREESAVLVAHARLSDVERTIETLRTATAPGAQADVVRDVAAATEAVRAARAGRDSALEARVRCMARDTDLAERERAVLQRLDETVSALERTKTGARAGEPDLPIDPETTSLEAVTIARAHLAQTERARMDELLGDGSRGLRGGAATLGLACAGPIRDSDEVCIEDRAGNPIESVLAELDRSLEEARTIVSDKTQELFDVIVVGSLAKQLQRDVEHLHATVADLNRLLARTELGGVRYAFRVVPRPERAELASLVRRMSALDPASRIELRSYLEGRRGELGAKGDDPPTLLDYRRWFEYRLVTRSAQDQSEETPWTRERRAAGSGGEQGVPSHLIVFALAKLTFDAASARVMPLLLDEAFQGIDAHRREGLLAFATELGLQLVVASPDQDGVVATARRTTTLFVVKDEHGDVHLAPYHYWSHAPAMQTTLELRVPARPE